MNSNSIKILLAYILITLIWGSTWLAIRIGLDSLTPLFSGGLRFLLASGFILILMKSMKLKLQTDRMSIMLYLGMAFFSFVIPFGLVYWAEQYIPSGLTSVLFAGFPFFVIIFSIMFIPGGGVDLFKILGSMVGFLGIIVIFSEDLSLNIESGFIPMAAVLTSAMLQGGIAVVIKKWGSHLNSISMNFVPLLTAGILMILMGFIFEDQTRWNFNTAAIGSVFYLAFFGTLIAFSTYYWLMKRINVVMLSLSSFITPIIALLLGWIILDESFTTRNIQGSSLVLLGILFANFSGLKKYFRTNFKSK